jgi:hypothetical protein
MLLDDIQQDALPVLTEVPSGGMIYYLQFESSLRGRRHQNTFFCTFNGGDKSVFDFFRDQQLGIGLRLANMQSWEVFQYGFTFVKLFPLPYVIMFIPTAYPGMNFEAAVPNSTLACVSFETLQTGRKRWMRKFLFGLPVSWVDGNHLSSEGGTGIFGMTSAWEQLWHPDYEEWPYTMGKMNRYINRSYHSPLNPINYWPLDRMHIRNNLVKHRHSNAPGH